MQELLVIICQFLFFCSLHYLMQILKHSSEDVRVYPLGGCVRWEGVRVYPLGRCEGVSVGRVCPLGRCEGVSVGVGWWKGNIKR